MNFRFISSGFLSSSQNMAIDEAILEHIAEHRSPPTLRLYGWKSAAISIGYFQNLNEETDAEACKKSSVDIVRRITGGGAVFHEHELTYSVHIPESLNIVPKGILESYEFICRAIICGLEKMGIQAKFVPLNDLVVLDNGVMRKISGNAQTRKRGVILQHGTILLKVDVDKMFSLLRVPDEKIKGKLIADIKQRVCGLSDCLNREVSFEETLQAVFEGFKEIFKEMEFRNSNISDSEHKRAKELVDEKYGTKDWNEKR